jgi:hypothetical protein
MSGRSATKLPNRRSDTIGELPELQSRYSGLHAWCTRWCVGVLSSHSSGPGVGSQSAWIQNWWNSPAAAGPNAAAG